MDTKTRCPDSSDLIKALDGTKPISNTLEMHIENCNACQATLDRLSNVNSLELYREHAQNLYDTTLSLSGPLQPGDIGSIDGLAIEKQIGAGSMGVVYQGRDETLGRTVAVKILARGSSVESDTRFLRESQAAAGVQHPNLVPVYSAGRAEDGRRYLVMPLIDGQSLKERIDDRPMSFRDAADTIKQVAEGLSAAHEAELIHRDVKPANILLDENDQLAKLTDFGLVRKATDETLTHRDVICGSPEYMSPEQASHPDLRDQRGDIYSLGITLYFCLTGTVPFRGRPLEVLAQHRETAPAPPSRLNYQIPRDLETICLKAIEKEPSRRYQTSELFAGDLKAFLEGRPITARPVSKFEKSWRWAKRNRALALSLSCMFLVLATCAIVSTILWRNSESNEKLARVRNAALVEQQTVMRENQIDLGKALRKTYLDRIDGNNAFMNLPIEVRNTLLMELATTWRLLFERSENEVDELRQMASELLRICDFTLKNVMRSRANEVTLLCRDITAKLIGGPGATPTAEDIVIAATAHNYFADALTLIGKSPEATLSVANRLSRRAMAIAREKHGLESRVYQLAFLQSLETKRLGIRESGQPKLDRSPRVKKLGGYTC